MKKGLLVQERIVLESLRFGPKCLEELECELQLSRDFLLNILSHLIVEGVISYKDFSYFIHKDSCLDWLEKREASEHKNREIMDLIRVGLHNPQQLIFRKVWMERDDIVVFERILQDFKTFLEYIEHKQSSLKDRRLHEQQMVMFMLGSYGQAIQELEKEVA